MGQARLVFRAVAIALMVFALFVVATAPAANAQGYGQYLPPNHINPRGLSQGAQAWWFGPDLPLNTSWPPPPATSVTGSGGNVDAANRSEEHTSEDQSPCNLVCRLLLEKKKKKTKKAIATSRHTTTDTRPCVHVST